MTAPSPDPNLVSMRCHGTNAGASYAWHSHPFHEITLVTEDTGTIQYAADEIPFRQTRCCYIIAVKDMGRGTTRREMVNPNLLRLWH